MKCLKHDSRFGLVIILIINIATITVSAFASQLSPKENFETNTNESYSGNPIENDAADIYPIMLSMNLDSNDREELSELLTLLEEETEIATKTRMNNEYVPGIVTILHGDHLEALGVRTVADALTMVPGIQLDRKNLGQPTVKVRGITYHFNAGNIKVMLNSIPISRESSGINSSILLMPVEQIDRIEVIRGPGSSIYGNFAMAGVVNIITRKKGGRVYSVVGDNDSKGGGGHYMVQNDEEMPALGLNVSMMDSGEQAAIEGSDPDEERLIGVFDLEYKNFALTVEGVQWDVNRKTYTAGQPNTLGPSYNVSEQDAETLEENFVRENSWIIEGRQAFELGPVRAQASVSYLCNNIKSDDPPKRFIGDRIDTGLDLQWLLGDIHQLLIGLSYTYSDIDDAYDRMILGKELSISGIECRNVSLSMQDHVTLSDKLSMTVGVRFDEYDDVGRLLTPRVAFVFHPAECHVFKAQYSEGFRAPTFWELYSSGTAAENLDFEIIGTTEFSYGYRNRQVAAHLTIYHSQIRQGIYGDVSGFENNIEIESKGIELEWEQRIGDKFRWLFNVSYNDTRDERTEDTADFHGLGIADWLGNLAFFMEPVPKLIITGRLLHVGDRHDTDGWIDGYDSIDFTISRENLMKKGITLRVGVKNAFDDDIVYLTDNPFGLSEYEYAGRAFWIQVAYDF